MNEEKTIRPARRTGHTLLVSLGGWTLSVAVLVAEIGLAAWIASTIGPRSIALAVLLMLATAAGAVGICIWLVVAVTRRLGRETRRPPAGGAAR
jgi:hypothetical protein